MISRRHLLILSFSSFFSGGISRLGRMGNANAKSPDFLAIVTRFQSGARHRPCTPCRAHCQPPLAVVDSLDWAWGCRTLKWGYCPGVSDHRVLLDTDIHRSCSDAYAHVCVTPPSLVLCWCRAPQTSIPTVDGFPESAERKKTTHCARLTCHCQPTRTSIALRLDVGSLMIVFCVAIQSGA